jgi:hypothetical protein
MGRSPGGSSLAILVNQENQYNEEYPDDQREMSLIHKTNLV